MADSTHERYSNRFKARVALEACGDEKIHELSNEHSIPVSVIEGWVKQLQDRAELLFIGDKAANQTEALHNHAALLRTTLEASPNGILVTDLDQNVITYNQKVIEMWGVPASTVETGNMEKAMEYVLGLLKNADAYAKMSDYMYECPEEPINDIAKLKDGRFFERYSVPYRAGNRILGRVTTFVNITEYKETEEQLTRFSNLLHSINANVNEGILRSTPDEGLVYVNEAFVNIFGYDSKEEVLRTEPAQFYAEQQQRNKLIRKLKEQGGFKNEEVLFRRKDGSTFWGLENSTMTENEGQIIIDGVVTDIDTRKIAEQDLRRSEEKYRTILKNIEEGYFETNLAGDFTFFNPTLVEMMKYPADKMIGMNNRDYMDEENAQKVFDTFNRVYQTGKSERGFDWKITCGDGSHIHVEASVTLRKDPASGEPIGYSGMVRDVTDRKQREKKIRKSLKEKEVLLGEIHHRVKNNLAVISGLLYLQAEKTDDQTAHKALMQSQNRINSMALIHELLYDNQTFSSLNPNVYIQQLVEHISSNLSTGAASITTNIDAQNFDLEMSTAIPCALIINELITNAYKYAFEERTEGAVEIVFTKNEDGYYKLVVADNGVGLPDDFTVKDSSKHGLGLSLVKTLTRQLKGSLDVTNGNGAKFIITFPPE